MKQDYIDNILSKTTMTNYHYLLDKLLPMDSVEYDYCSNCGGHTSFEKGSLFGVDYTYESCCAKLELKINTKEELDKFIKKLYDEGVIDFKTYKIIWNYSDNDTVEITNILTNETLYSGSVDTIPDLPEFKAYIISKITLGNYTEFIDEFDLDWDYTSEPSICDQCGSWDCDKSGERFGIKYEYSKGCFGEYLIIHVDSNESLREFITKLNLNINTFVFGSRKISEIDYFNDCSDEWVV